MNIHVWIHTYEYNVYVYVYIYTSFCMYVKAVWPKCVYEYISAWLPLDIYNFIAQDDRTYHAKFYLGSW